jgi:hypothetical protein
LAGLIIPPKAQRFDINYSCSQKCTDVNDILWFIIKKHYPIPLVIKYPKKLLIKFLKKNLFTNQSKEIYIFNSIAHGHLTGIVLQKEHATI